MVELAVRPEAPVVKKKLAKAGAFDPLEKLLGNDLVSVDVGSIENCYQAGVNLKWIHIVGAGPVPARIFCTQPCRNKPCPYDLYFHSLTSTKCPAIAAAAAIAGLTRCVRPPRPCLPSKFRLLVDAHRSSGSRVSAFMPRHIEQPDSRPSKPASRKIRSSPPSSATRFTFCDPGTTMARTELLTV